VRVTMRKVCEYDNGTTTANLNSEDLSMSCRPISCRCDRFASRFALLVFLLLGAAALAYSQDAVRPSLAGELASEARKQDISRIPYNLIAGPIRFRVGASLGVEYNDNINYAEVGKQDDVIITPNLSVDAIWPVTELNTLQLNLGLGYSFYLDHSSDNTDAILIAPNSQLAFDIFVGDFRINIHDRMSLQQDPIAEAALSNVSNYGRFENTAGVSVLWDLNKIQVTLGYDHYNFVSTTSQFDYLNRNAEILSGSICVLVTPTISMGPEANAVFTRYNQSVLSNNTDYSVGGFAEVEITNNLKVRVAGGYQHIGFDNNFVDFGGMMFLDQMDLSDYYANILVTHRLNATISQAISAGHENQLGVNSNYITLNYVRHTITWNIIRNTLLTTEFFYEDAEESGGTIAEHFNRIGGAITLGYQLTPHVTLGVRYQGTSKDSDVALQDYNQNRVSVDGTYSF
jgi:opacity protein-like surface antigen